MKRFKILIVIALSFLFTEKTNAQVYKCKDGSVSFFSEAPIENIDAHSTALGSVLNTKTNEIAFIVPVTSFRFKKTKMQTDFNESYMESDKFPDATYNGKISSEINWTKDGTYQVISTGTLIIHGVSKTRTDTASVTIKNGNITIESNFWVKLADHEIKIPKLVIQNIAEVVNVKFNCNYMPGEK